MKNRPKGYSNILFAVKCIVWDMKAKEDKNTKFAQKHKDWTVNNWEQVMWYEETLFRLSHADGLVRI